MLVLFDIDGTLLDHQTAEHSAATLLHKRANLSVPLHEFLSRWSAALDRHFARYLAKEVSYQGQRRDRVRAVIDLRLSDEAADRIFAQYLADYQANWSLYSDVIPCLDSLLHCRLGVISNGEGQQQRGKLAQTGILDRFDWITISQECGYAKPDPAIFHGACAEAGESPDNVIYVGDRYDLDAHAARVAGLRGIWLDRNHCATSEHVPPIVDSLEKIRSLLKK